MIEGWFAANTGDQEGAVSRQPQPNTEADPRYALIAYGPYRLRLFRAN